MKYKFLKITGELVWGSNEIEKEDLIRRKQNGYDAIIDVETQKYYDPENNEWKIIEGD